MKIFQEFFLYFPKPGIAESKTSQCFNFSQANCETMRCLMRGSTRKCFIAKPEKTACGRNLEPVWVGNVNNKKKVILAFCFELI